MKKLVESMRQIQPMSEYINGSIQRTSVSEAFSDLLSRMKRMFKQAWIWMKGVVIKAGSYIIPVNDEGNPLPAITPMTAL